jgi:hypothetical protein
MKREQSTRKQAILDVLVGLACILVVVGCVALGSYVSSNAAPPNHPICYRIGPCQ